MFLGGRNGMCKYYLHEFRFYFLDSSQYAAGRVYYRSYRLWFSVVFLGPRANAELVRKFTLFIACLARNPPNIT
jgi:hypothetical protein